MQYYSCVLVAVVAVVPLDKMLNAIEVEQGKEVKVILDGETSGRKWIWAVSWPLVKLWWLLGGQSVPTTITQTALGKLHRMSYSVPFR
jgi:hypothetical protein